MGPHIWAVSVLDRAVEMTPSPRKPLAGEVVGLGRRHNYGLEGRAGHRPICTGAQLPLPCPCSEQELERLRGPWFALPCSGPAPDTLLVF